jgi:hypothetical protein
LPSRRNRSELPGSRRDALKRGEAAVEFARFEFHDGKQWTDTTYYVALVITSETKDHPAYIVLGDDKQLEGESLVEFQRSVQDDGADSADEASAEHVPPAVKAYDLYWRPLEPLLQGKTRVYLSLDGVLNQIPLGLMDAGDSKLLMEKYDLRLLSSTKDSRSRDHSQTASWCQTAERLGVTTDISSGETGSFSGQSKGASINLQCRSCVYEAQPDGSAHQPSA